MAGLPVGLVCVECRIVFHLSQNGGRHCRGNVRGACLYRRCFYGYGFTFTDSVAMNSATANFVVVNFYV